MGSKTKTSKRERDVAETQPEKEKVKKSKTVENLDPWFAENYVKVDKEVVPCKTFEQMKELNFPKKLVKACLEKFGKDGKPSAVQAATWPLIMAGKDVCGIAKTGSGKTLAFFLPFLARSQKGVIEIYEQPCKYTRMVALAPTRELAMQIEEVGSTFSKVLDGKDGSCTYPVICIVGGIPKFEQRKMINTKGADVVVATPGRLQDIADEGMLDLSCTKFLVLDEADRMLDQGFVMAVRALVKLMPESGERQTVCFSATWPTSVHRLASEMMKKPVTVTVTSKTDGDEAGQEDQLRANDMITQHVDVMADDKQKFSKLLKILKEHDGQRTLIFALYKKEAANLEFQLQKAGFKNVCALQGDMTQDKRSKAIEDFKSGACNPLVATDVAGRGLDVKDVKLVVNYTFPLNIEDYVHRIGRTGRGGKSGKAITFFNESGDWKEKEHAFSLMRVLEASKQEVPQKLKDLAGSTFCATKKKEHPIYGKFFKDEAEMKKLEEKKVHMTFDSDDE